MADKREDLREILDNDLWSYARYVLPDHLFGDIHRELFQAMGDPDRLAEVPNLLALIPRDHLKSRVAATYCTWRIARDPTYTILYITADEDLGRLQMTFMKGIFESDRFQYLWPEHFSPDNGRREKWTGLAITSDHPDRVSSNQRDETICCKTVKSGKTGRHPNEIVFDDLVVPENAYTERGREEVRSGAAQAVSLLQADGLMTAVGTTYHLSDQYSIWKGTEYEVFDDEGNWIENKPLWKVIERRVENAGDGSGDFLWPRTKAPNSDKWFGFDRNILARKRATYQANGEITQFMAQYYMEPNDPGSHRITADQYVYGNKKFLLWDNGRWEYKGKPLRIMATMDTAITDAASKNAIKADFTAIMVVGVDSEGFFYVLEMDQFQTDDRSVYYKHLVDLWVKWQFKRVKIEQESAGKVIAGGIKELLRADGHSLIVEGENAPRGITKFERHAAITLPKYEQGSVIHFKGGLTLELEEQITKPRPAHDDLLDCITMALETLKPPQATSSIWSRQDNVITASGRFGGRR